MAGIGLYNYKARYYDPLIGRFISADTVTPGGPQGLNRYSYSLNNPILYNDPTGHCPLCILVAVALIAVILTGDIPQMEPPSTNYPINAYGGAGCWGSLSDCFGDSVVLKDFSGNGTDNPISADEFNNFTDKVASDLYDHDLDWPGLDAGRQAYDTPFYNGGESTRRINDPDAEKGVYPSTQQVYIEGVKCSGRSEINYLAQGMYGAAVGEPKAITFLIMETWKLEEYQELASKDTIFWLNYGYDYYQRWKKYGSGSGNDIKTME